MIGLFGDQTLFEAMQSNTSFLGIAAVLFSIVEIVFVYGDDLKAKTMQMAIGTGMPRQKVVHAKWLEFMLVSAFDLIVMAILMVVSQVIWRGTEGGFLVGAFLFGLFMSWLRINAYLGSVMFILFWNQGISLTLVLFLIMGSGQVPLIVEAIGSLVELTRFHFQTYTLTSYLDIFEARALMGHFSVTSAIGILVYMILGFALASILFKKKELEF